MSPAPRAILWTLPLLGLLTRLLTGCAAHQPAVPVTPPLAVPSVVTRPVDEAPMAPSGIAPSTAPTAATPEPSAAPPTPPAAPPAPLPRAPAVVAQLEPERPYKTFQRPRAQGPVFAAGEDETLARWNLGGTGDPNFISNRAGFHPGARVVVDTELVAGQLPEKSGSGLSQRSLLAQSRSRGYWPLRLCYEEALRRDPKSSGETRIRLSIGRSGNVTRAQLKETALDAEAARCLSLAVESLSYAPGPAAGLVAVDFSVKFWRGDAPLPAVGPAPGILFENPGRLEPDVVAEVLAPAIPALTSCYARGLAKDPALWGRLGLRIDLTAAGAIASVHEDESRFPDREVSECVVAQVGQLTFPAPAGGRLSFVQAFRLGTPPAPSPPALEPSP